MRRLNYDVIRIRITRTHSLVLIECELFESVRHAPLRPAPIKINLAPVAADTQLVESRYTTFYRIASRTLFMDSNAATPATTSESVPTVMNQPDPVRIYDVNIPRTLYHEF